MKYTFKIKKPIQPEDNYTIIHHDFWKLDISMEDRVVLGYLMSHKDMQPITHGFIAEALHVSRKFVGDSLKRLEACGHIEINNKILSVTQSYISDKNTKCNPKLQISVTQSDTNKKNKQKEKKQDDLASVTQSYTSQATEVAVQSSPILDLISVDIPKEVFNNFKISNDDFNGYTISNIGYYASQYQKKKIKEDNPKLKLFYFFNYWCKRTSNSELKKHYDFHLNEND